VLLLLSFSLTTAGGQPAQTVTFCTSDIGGGDDHSERTCYPGVEQGTARVDACTTQAGEYRGDSASTAPEAFQAYAVMATTVTNTSGGGSCQLFHMEFFSGDSCDPQHAVANTTLCSVGCDAEDHTPCSAVFALVGSNSTIGAYVPTVRDVSSSPSPAALSSRHDNEPVVPGWVIVVILVCSVAGAALLILPAVVGVWLYRRRRTRASYDYVPAPSTTNC
jgi:hypothetical protein